MKYVGMYTQIRNNNMKTIMLLLLFPAIILGMVWVFLALLNYFGGGSINWMSQQSIIILLRPYPG